jgi:hypothetical protein
MALVARTGSFNTVVLSTVRHAGDLNYRLVVVRDCCADPDAEVHAMQQDLNLRPSSTSPIVPALSNGLQ